MELKGKTALVTGSGIRLGRAIALALGKEGCDLALHYNRSSTEVDEVQEKLTEIGVRAKTFSANLRKKEAIDQLWQQVTDELGVVDILVNNAGIYLPGNGMATSYDTIQAQMELHVYAPLWMSQAFRQQLPAEVPGKIVNIADSKVFKRKTDHFAYRISKRALIEMTQLLALELAPDITVNAVAPGIMMPLAGHEDTDMDAVAERRIPLKRIGSPELIANAVVYLLKEDFITGQILRLDGGENL